MANNYFANDGTGIQWFGSTTYPAAFYVASTNITWVFREVVGPAGDPDFRGVRCDRYDHAAGEWLQSRWVADNPLEDDTHGVPAACRDHEGYIHVFLGAHASDLFHYVSDAPDDPTSFSLVHTFSGDYTYPHPVLVGSALYVFLRKTISASTKMPTVRFKTTALSGGTPTWGSEQTIIDFGTDSRNYMGPAVVSGTLIHFVQAFADFADTVRQHVYHYVYDTSDESIENSSGGVSVAVGSQPINLSTSNASFRVVDTGTDRLEVPAFVLDSAGAPHIVYPQGTGGANVAFPLFHVKFASGSWSSPAAVGASAYSISTSSVEPMALVALPAQEVALYFGQDASSAFARGGNMTRVVRSAAGAWGAATVVYYAPRATGLGSPSAVVNGHADARVIFCETVATENLADGSEFRAYAYGDNGILRRYPNALQIVRETSGLLDYWSVNGAFYVQRQFSTGDWVAGSGNSLGATLANGLIITRSGAGSDAIGFVRNTDVPISGEVFLFARMSQHVASRFGIVGHITDVTSGSEDGVVLSVLGPASGTASLVEVVAGSATSLDSPGSFAAGTDDVHAFALYLDGNDAVAWDDLSNADYAGTTATQVSGRVGVRRSGSTALGEVRVRQFHAATHHLVTVSGLPTGYEVQIHNWEHTELASASESGGDAEPDVLKVNPLQMFELQVYDGPDLLATYRRTDGDHISGGDSYLFGYRPLTPETTALATDTDVALGSSDYAPHPDGPAPTHFSTTWQVALATDPDFDDAVVNVTTEADLLAHLVDGLLTASTAYIARHRFTDALGLESDWSEVVAFTTQDPAPTPEDPVLSDPPTNTEEDEVTLTVSAFEHNEGETTAELYDPLTNDLPYPFARRWQITTNADTGFAADPMLVDTELTSDIDLVRTFGGLAASTTYRARTLVQDGKYGTLSDWSNVVVFTTDATPVDRPGQPTITATCTGRGATLAGDTFDPFGVETHVLTQWRARPELESGNGQDSTQTAIHLTSFAGWTALPMGTWLFDVRYKGSNGKWSLWSVPDSCDVYDRPPTPVVESPVSGKVISAPQLITISMPPVIDVDWNFVWEARQEGGVFVEVQNSDDLTYTFPILNKNNAHHEVRVKACYPEGHDAEGVCSDWALVKLRVDRTGIRAVSYSFVGLTDPEDIPGDPLLIWDNEDDDVTAELVDADLGGEGPSVGILMKNHRVLSTRQAVLALRALGQPIAGRFTASFSIVGRERGVWWGWKWSQTHFMKPGIAYRAIGTGATNRSGLQLVARTGIQPYPFYPQTNAGTGDRGSCICSFPSADDSCSWCIVNGTPCAPCTTCHGMPTSCSCVAAAADAAKRSRVGSGGTLYEYGISSGRGSIERFGRVQGSGNLQFYQNATLIEESGPRRGLGVTTSRADPDTGECLFVHHWYTMEVDVQPEAGQWRVKARVLGPGMDPDTWTQNALLSLGDETTGSMPCGYCGLALYHIASNLTDDYGVLFRSFAASDLEYGACEPPEDVIIGCEADWDFTTFEPDDITPHYGSYSGDFLTGQVAEASYYTLPSCPRPYLKPPRDFSETEIDYPAGASTIGSIKVGVVDKRLVASDQSTGLVSAFAADYIGRRAILRRWREDLGMVTVFDGIIDSYEVDSTSVVTYWFNLRDPRERERDVELFSKNETFALWPEDGPIASYGFLGLDAGYLLTPAQPADALEFTEGAGSGPDIFYGYVTLASALGEEAEYIERVLSPFGLPTYNSDSGLYEHSDITVRWRPAAGGDWVYLRDMPSLAMRNAIEPPATVFPFSSFVWRLYMASTDAADLPDDEDLVDIQILAAKTTETTPFFWDNGSFGDLLLEIYQGEHTKNPPRIRYNEEELAAFATETPSARFIVREPAKNLREWVQENIYAPIGYAPAFDTRMRIVPSAWELPPADEELVELDRDWIIPVGQFSDSVENVINRVTYTYIREYVLPPGVSGGIGTVLKIAVQHDALREIYGDSAWTRLVEQPIPREYVYPPSMFLGENKIDYKPVTVRSTGGLGEALLPILGIDNADRIADGVGIGVLSRFRWGAAEYVAEIRAGMAHGPTFDPFTLDLVVGQWVRARVPWLPEYSEGVRNLYRYMQITSITDPSIDKRRVRLIDGGPVLTLGGESEDVEDLLDPPTIGTLTETAEFRIQVPIALPVGAPAGYTARVEYAVNATEPAALSGLWTLAGTTTTDGDVLTPIISAGARVWVRARGEVAGRRPSAWADAESIDLLETPGLTSVRVTIDDAGIPTLEWTKNAFAGGLEIEDSIGAFGHTASFSPWDEVDADDLEAELTSEVVAYGEEIYVQITAYEGFMAGSVTGASGGVYVVSARRPFPYSDADHGFNDHLDTDLGAASDRADATAPVWNLANQKYESVPIPTLPIDLTTDVTGVLPVGNGGTGLSAVGTALQLLRTNAAATAMEWWTLLVNLASQVTGTLPVANGGTGLTAVGTTLQLLRTNAAATALEFWTLTVNAATQITGVLPEANGGVPAGGSAGQVLTKDSSSDHDASWQTPGTTSGTLSVRANRSAGNVATVSTHTTYQDVDTATDLVIAAASGDVLEVGVSIRWASENTLGLLDAVTVVSGSPVNYISGHGSTGNGVLAWMGEAAVTVGQGGTVQYVVQSGDISSGNVTLRLRFRAGTNTTKTIRADSTAHLNWHAKNLKQ